jgi:hypothetical protein
VLESNSFLVLCEEVPDLLVTTTGRQN